MSMIIKGISLPEEVGNVISITLYDKKDNWLDNIEVYRKDIVEIPTPHGRLIDGDEFKSWVDDWYDCTDIGNIVESWIDERPTILEEEK